MSDPLRRKFEGLESIPLFGDKTLRRRQRQPKTRSPKAWDIVRCPECDRKVALHAKTLRDGRRVLTFKRHDRITNSGARFQCRMSNQEASSTS